MTSYSQRNFSIRTQIMLRDTAATKPGLTPSSTDHKKLSSMPTSTTPNLADSEAHFVQAKSQLLVYMDLIKSLLVHIMNESSSIPPAADGTSENTGAIPTTTMTINTNITNSNSNSHHHTFYCPPSAIRTRPVSMRRYASYDESSTPKSGASSPSHPTTPVRLPNIAEHAYEKLKVFELDDRAYNIIQNPYSASPDTNTSNDSNAISYDVMMGEIAASLAHLDKLKARILDTRSKLLVTGDLNAGKSTFINAMLKRQVVPHDQQPCTAVFCEVIDANQNRGIEEVHGIHDIEPYRVDDPHTYERFDLKQLEELVENNTQGFGLLRAYVRDRRESSDSLLHNGLVDISLIDSPGLNIDQMKTTALFSRQEEIDVIVFMVNAENHFTLSAREFLSNAGKEKAYVFIVVNRFDQIEKKDRCRRDVLDQIRQISPSTYEDAESLVHFVSAKQRLIPNPDPILLGEFEKLEARLRTFILEKRARSKLAPAKQYMVNLLSDMYTFSSYTASILKTRAKKMTVELKQAEPAYTSMKDVKTKLLDSLDVMIDAASEQVQNNATLLLKNLVDSISPDNIDHLVPHLEYPGFLYAYQYGRELVRCVLKLSTDQVRRCEIKARNDALDRASSVYNAAAMALPNLPPLDEDVIRQIFDEEAGMSTLAATRGNSLVLDSTDFFEPIAINELVKEYVPGTIAVALGAVGYAGMQWRIAHGLFRVGSSIGFANTVRIGFAAITASGIGYLVYMLSSLPKTIDRKISRKLRSHFNHINFVNTHSARLANAMRKSLRASLGTFKIQFLGMMAESEAKQSGLEKLRDSCASEGVWWENVESRVVGIRKQVEFVNLDI
ncbi:hypothetical protein SmJEL517_g03314 [Synchytrium microbalum]|uniref:Dynamin-type G domain-containing protein n=1 Tax=Synchytrium microbalum TaxID=1806994 RepID=A0A507C8R7_9FUNG|nr:uncharacterized protein SmJEL517_g03314 [Synchytrium microbalum]TPX33895.1 hypothetical protein SmJEL517_g03314 [Synchytrium microbalum]